MKFSLSSTIMFTIGTVIAVLSILTSEYSSLIVGYLALLLSFAMAFVICVNSKRSFEEVRWGTKLFLGLGLIVWMLLVNASAVLAVL